MLLPIAILFLGCKHQSGYDRLVSGMDGSKAIQSQYVIHQKGQKDVTVNFLFSKPNRFLVTSDDFTIASNEVDGHFESLDSEKVYDLLPPAGPIYPGTGKLLSPHVVRAGPASATNPKDFASNVKWQLKSNTGGIETYSKTIESQQGPMTFTLVVNSDGKPIKFMSPGIEYEIKSFEYLDEQPLEKFRVEPKDGYVCVRIPVDTISLETGEKFTWTQFKASSDVSDFKPTGPTLFAIVDPKEPTSVRSLDWIKKVGNGYTKVQISKGDAQTGFVDPSGVEIDKITTTTPAFFLVDPDGTIKGMWLGFDAEGTLAFEADIQKAISGKT